MPQKFLQAMHWNISSEAQNNKINTMRCFLNNFFFLLDCLLPRSSSANETCGSWPWRAVYHAKYYSSVWWWSE